MNPPVQLLVFNLDERNHALYLRQVERVVRAVDATPVPQAPDIVLGVISLQNKLVPLLSLRRRLGIADREIGIDDQFIIAQTSRRTVALMVDRVDGVIEQPAEDIVETGKAIDPTHQIEGVIQLQDGLTLIHDLDRFLSLDEERALEAALTGGPSDAR